MHRVAPPWAGLGALMSKRKQKFEFTDYQVGLIAWALRSGAEQFRLHLLHDDWDVDLPIEAKRQTLTVKRDFARAIEVFERARTKTK